MSTIQTKTIAPWDSAITYAAGAVVLDRGGIWQATGSNTNSEPISGNTHWTLIGGTPYVDVFFSPAQLISTPFLDPTPSGPGVVMVPAPGANLIVYPIQIDVLVTQGDAWEQDANPWIVYGTPQSLVDDVPPNGVFTLAGFGSIDYVANYLPDPSPTQFWVRQYYTQGPGLLPNAATNQPLVTWSDVDPSDGGMTVGSRALGWRLYYGISQALLLAPQSYFTITAVVQGAKTFTVTDTDALLSGVTGSIVITGSTGNDGTYTIVSAVAGAGSTVITVAEAIPSATADGWVNQ